MRRVLLVWISLLAAVHPAQLPITDLQQDLRAQAAEVEHAWEQYPDNPCVLYQVAAMFAQAGHKAEALSTLRVMVDKHSGVDPRLRDGFQSLANDPEFLRLKKQIRAQN